MRGFLVILFFLCLLSAGCNGVKVVGQTVETYGNMRVTVQDGFRHVGPLTCLDMGDSQECKGKRLEYRADYFVKSSGGVLKEFCMIISKSTTGSSIIRYDNGKFFDHEGVRYSSFFHAFDLNNLDQYVEIKAHMDFLRGRGIDSGTGKLYAYVISKRLDSKHYVLMAYGIPGDNKLDNMESGMVKALLKDGLFLKMDVQKRLD